MLVSSTSSLRAYSPLEVGLAPPIALRRLLLTIHVLAGVALWVAGLPLFTGVVLSCLLLLSLYAALKELSSDKVFKGIVWAVDKKVMSLVDCDGKRIAVEGLVSSALFPGLVVLKLVRSDRLLPCWLFVTPGRCSSPDAWRRLRLAVQLAPPLQRDASGQG